jgi:ACR3 family arsenite transporter
MFPRANGDDGDSTARPEAWENGGKLMETADVRRLSLFERYLTLWVALCMIAGIALGKLLPGLTDGLRRMEFGYGSQINVPIALLIWLMIYPMMLKVDFASVVGVGKRPGGLLITCSVNWLVKPFSMALIGYVFFKHAFLRWIEPELADQYIAGVIILAAAPCTAMVFVWSYLTRGDAAYTLVQVAVNDLLMLVLFAPIVTLLIRGTSGLSVPFIVLVYAVICFIVIPLAAGAITRRTLIRRRGAEWFEQRFLPRFHPVAVLALLATLVLIFAFQADNITKRFFHVVLIAIPILIQVYCNSWLTYGLMKAFRMPHRVAAPGALIGASNFFELAVATAIALYGPESGAALATVVGVLVEVPVMLSVCAFCNRTRGWFDAASAGDCPSPAPGCCANWRAFAERSVVSGHRDRSDPPVSPLPEASAEPSPR